MLYKHQQDLLDAGHTQRLVAFGCGAGKTRAVLELCRKVGGDILVVAPKTQVQDQTWEREAVKMGWNAPMTVISKESFKKHAPKRDILVIDEAHFAAGVLAQTRYKDKIEIPRTSQVFESVVAYVKMHKPKAVYLATATPFPSPMALWAYARIFGEDWDYFAFRRKFYIFVPNIGRGVWLPKRDEESKALLQALAGKFSSFGRLEDLFDVPPQVDKDVHVGLSGKQKRFGKGLPLIWPDPLIRIGKSHQLEQGILDGDEFEEWKSDEIIELAKEFDKLLVFARYTGHIDMLEKKLRKTFKKKDILVLDGRTRDRRELIEKAEDKKRSTIVIAQSQVSTGYELPSFRCTIFASMSYSYIDYEQARGRTLRANALAKNVYVHLTAGDIDKRVLVCVREKRDFNERLFAKEEL